MSADAAFERTGLVSNSDEMLYKEKNAQVGHFDENIESNQLNKSSSMHVKRSQTMGTKRIVSVVQA